MKYLDLCIKNETSRLKSVLVGIAQDINPIVHHNNPKITDSVNRGLFPSENELVTNIRTFVNALEENGVEVLRPQNIPGNTQIFTRDIGFVIEDKFLIANMRKDNRKREIEGIRSVIEQMNQESVISPPANVQIEGGDIIVHGDIIFVGLGERTNKDGVEFLKNTFPQKEIIPIRQRLSSNPYEHILHLDCAFQPIGKKMAIIHKEGIEEGLEAILDIFGENNLISVTKNEMYDMYPNIFSITPELVVVESGFHRLKTELRKNSIKTVEVAYDKVGRLGGLLRCSTLPLMRK